MDLVFCKDVVDNRTLVTWGMHAGPVHMQHMHGVPCKDVLQINVTTWLVQNSDKFNMWLLSDLENPVSELTDSEIGFL